MNTMNKKVILDCLNNHFQEELGKEVDIVREHKHIDFLLMEMIQKDIIYV